MPTVFVTGDLFAYEGLEALAHGCNCAGAMGKGSAVEFRARFPAMYAEYKRRCAAKRFTVGDVFEWTEAGMTIFNLGTQATWRTGAKLTDIETALCRMLELARAHGITRVGLPRIGAGLGGLPWPQVRDLLMTLGEASTIELVVFEEYQPTAR
jgi:O-acetyl-ADP-ribose deacetylase (regulator of RNase III)